MEKKAKGQPPKEVKKQQIYIGVREDIIEKIGGLKSTKLLCLEYLERMSGIKNK